MKIKELLGGETKWAKGFEAYDGRGLSVPYDSLSAVKWCLVGAINKCYPSSEDQDMVVSQIQGFLEVCDLAEWNDGATFEDVKSLTEELDI